MYRGLDRHRIVYPGYHVQPVRVFRRIYYRIKLNGVFVIVTPEYVQNEATRHMFRVLIRSEAGRLANSDLFPRMAVNLRRNWEGTKHDPL